MLIYGLTLIAAVAQTPTRVNTLSWPASEPLAIACPRDRPTRIVFPEPLKRLKTSAADREAFGLRVERATPDTAIVLWPARHPAQGELELRGTTLSLRLRLSTTAEGEAQEWRLSAPDAPAPLRAETPSAPAREAKPTPSPTAAGTPATAVPKADAAVWTELQWARAVPIGRREGLPGRPALIVEDALIDETWVIYRLRLEDGAREEVAALEWEHGPIAELRQTVAGADRRLLVRVPRKLVSRHTRIALRLASGRVYHVAPFPPTLGGLYRRLFK